MRLQRAVSVVGAFGLLLAHSVAAGEPQDPYVEITKLLASDGGFVDFFGETLAIDGDTVVVGGDDIGVGGAYVYERNREGSNAWSEVVKLLAPDESDNFGRDVYIEGDVIAVGATDVDQVGSVYFFERDAGGPGQWGLTAKLLSPDGPVRGQVFSNPVLDGDTVLVGASGDSDGGVGAGAVFVFERDLSQPEGWRFSQKLIGSDPQDTAKYGSELDIDGDTMIVASPFYDLFLPRVGTAFILEREKDGAWVEKLQLFASITWGDGKFGQGVSIEGDLIAIGHPGNAAAAGEVYVYGRDIGGPGAWGVETVLTASDAEPGSFFGVAIDLQDDRLIVGAERSNIASDGAGAVYVFERNPAGDWVELARHEASDATRGDLFGSAVGLSGGTLVVGAHLNDESGTEAGAAYVFQAVAHPEITVTGSCPGEVVLNLDGATPSGSVLVARSTSEGATLVPGDTCAGLELELEGAELLSRFSAEADGSRSLVRTAPAAACETYLQAVDAVTCSAGPVVRLP